MKRSYTTVAAEKEISEERMARRQAIGSKYSVRLDPSVSGDLQKLKDRLAAAKAELSAIRADVVIATSPVRRTPPDPPRATALPPKKKPIQPAPASRPPVYSLRQPPLARQPVVKGGPGLGVPARESIAPIAAGRKPRVGNKQQRTKVEEVQVDSRPGRQKAAVGKPLAKPGAAATRPVRPTQQKKPTTSHQQHQAPPQRRVPPAQTVPKPRATGRPAGTLERQKLPRTTNPDAAPRKREVKKNKESVSPRPKDGNIFPADVDTQYTMKKFMAQRESEISTSTVTVPQKTGVEVAKDVSEVVDVDKLHQVSADETVDKMQGSWLAFRMNADQLEHLKSGANFSDFPQPPRTTPERSDSRFKGASNEEKQNVSVSKTAASYVHKTSTVHKMSTVQNEHGTKDDVAHISAANYETVKTAMSTAEKFEDENVRTEKDAVENKILSESTKKKVQTMQSDKPLIDNRERARNREGSEPEPDTTKLDIVQKDEDKQIVHAKKTENETGREATEGRELDRVEDKVEDRESSVSMFDDHHTLPDDNVYDELRMSAEVPLSIRSDNDPELAALSATSSVSRRDLASPSLPFGSPAGDVEATQAAADQKPDVWKYMKESNPDVELVKVIDKERKTEIIVDLGDRKREGDQAVQDEEKDDVGQERSTSPKLLMSKDDESLKADDGDADSMLSEGSVHPLRDNEDDEEEICWSGSDNEEVDELMQLAFGQRDSFEEDTEQVDRVINTRDLSDNEDKDEANRPVTLLHENKEVEHEPGKKMDDVTSLEVNTKPMEEAVAEDDVGSIADEQITKETFERIVSNAGLTEDTEVEHGNEYSDDNFISAPISGARNYLEEEYGLPSLTSLDREEELDEALRGEGPPMYQDEEAAGQYCLGEDGMPDFGAEYYAGIAAERSEEGERAAVTEGDGHILSESNDDAMSKLVGTKRPERMDDEVSILPDAAQSEEWDDALYDLSNPASAVELQEPETRAEPDVMFGVVVNRQDTEEKTIIKA